MLPVLVGEGLLTPADGFLWVFSPVVAELLSIFTANYPSLLICWLTGWVHWLGTLAAYCLNSFSHNTHGDTFHTNHCKDR